MMGFDFLEKDTEKEPTFANYNNDNIIALYTLENKVSKIEKDLEKQIENSKQERKFIEKQFKTLNENQKSNLNNKGEKEIIANNTKKQLQQFPVTNVTKEAKRKTQFGGPEDISSLLRMGE